MNQVPRENVFDFYEVESPIATELRRLYSNMSRKLEGRTAKSFLITSSSRGEGKSTVAAYLALTIAQFPKKKVVIVDADLRRPHVHMNYGLPNEGGLTECLGSSRDPLMMIKKTSLPNLDVLTAGVPPDAPSRLFESEILSEVFEKLEFYYDVVIVDSAPVLAVSDTLFLSREIEWVLFVVLAGVTPKALVQRAKDVLLDGQSNIMGVIVNNVTQVLPYHYDHKYYGKRDEMS